VANTPSTPDHPSSQDAWSALQRGAQPLWQTVQQWTVAVILGAIIFLGCYTLLLTWPLTQPGSKLEIAQRCEATTAFNGFTGQIYRLVTDPCQDRANQTDDPKARPDPSAQAGAAAPAPASDQADAGAPGPDTAEDSAPAEAADAQSTAPEADSPNTAVTAEADETGGVQGDAEDTGAPPAETEPENNFPAFAEAREANALFVAVLAAGITGGAVFSLRSHTIHVARRTHDHSWGLWNLSRPFLGGALAVIFFFLIRAGFVQNGEVNALRPEGFIALAALVGLFTDQAWARMRIVAESLFAKRDDDTRSTPANREEAAERPGAGETERPAGAESAEGADRPGEEGADAPHPPEASSGGSARR
jgi:hypothetical protein